MDTTSTKRIAGGIVITGAAGIAGLRLARGKLRNWGATRGEIARFFPGDELVPDATYLSTRAVTIDAPRSAVWPWLAQMGYRRGGLYSYDWLDRLFGYLDAPSADTVLPEFQYVKAGDTIPMGRGPSWPVQVAEPERALVLEPVKGRITWSFYLLPHGDDATRLVTRVRCAPPASLAERITMAVLDPAAFVMTRGMLLGIKRRAEAFERAREAERDAPAREEQQAVGLFASDALGVG
ncbi:MAG TPA: hypothetical protein VFS59_06360 [Gemmatimonadaceae bacterium]|nr:hypothetical protein [Gemmatimonadaceae bacterium]